MTERRYGFSWELLGDIGLGRPNLGGSVRLEVYRLMQFTLRDVLEQQYGTEEADRLFREAGKKAGRAFYEHYLSESTDVGDFVKRLQDTLKTLQIGILRVEKMSPGAERLTLTVDEDVDCSGMPETTFEVCVYDEGFISGILESFTGTPYDVKEIDCWCTGDRTCRFSADAVGGAAKAENS